LALVAVWIDWPGNPGFHIQGAGITIDKPIAVKEGLDLQGGLSVLLQAQPVNGQQPSADTMQAAMGVIENRINGLGVAEPVINLAGSNRIIVELPGLKDPAQAIKLFGSTGELEFLATNAIAVPVGCPIPYANGSLPSVANPPQGCPTPQQLGNPQVVVGGSDVQTASVGYDNLGQPIVNVTLKSQGGTKMSAYTAQNVQKYLTITMDRVVVESAVIQQQFGANFQISGGSMSLADAQRIVLEIKYGALPVPMVIEQQQQVGPTLGQDSINRSIIAGIIGLAIVMAFMLLYYKLPGFLADLALIIYALLVFAIFKWIPVTLTLAGTAGFILSIGMAVDANVLTFERLKEELRSGKSLRAAMEAAFDRAWPSIRDSNISTMLTCGVLYAFGTGPIRGFALTLFIGVVTSLFSAIFVTRTFLRVVAAVPAVRRPRLFGVESAPANA
ncbi:MAG TPA: protein translocase subunit SecD, partial [Chloroflexota bacterium]|nr:protein translocase subunit SecD [Chloroflexota bacterium]